MKHHRPAFRLLSSLLLIATLGFMLGAVTSCTQLQKASESYTQATGITPLQTLQLANDVTQKYQTVKRQNTAVSASGPTSGKEVVVVVEPLAEDTKTEAPWWMSLGFSLLSNWLTK